MKINTVENIEVYHWLFRMATGSIMNMFWSSRDICFRHQFTSHGNMFTPTSVRPSVPRLASLPTPTCWIANSLTHNELVKRAEEIVLLGKVDMQGCVALLPPDGGCGILPLLSFLLRSRHLRFVWAVTQLNTQLRIYIVLYGNVNLIQGLHGVFMCTS